MSISMASAVSSCALNGAGTHHQEQQNGNGRNGKQVSYAKDLKLALQARSGNGHHFEQLRLRFAPIIQLVVKGFYLPGGDKDDLHQEALIGLYKAICDYDGTSSSLASFVRLCVERQVITAVKTATRQKHQSLNQADSFDKPLGDEGFTLGELFEDPVSSTFKRVEDREYLAELLCSIESDLTELERNVLRLWVADYSYAEIADHLSINEKVVDNALQRVRRKFEQVTSTHGYTRKVIPQQQALLPVSASEPDPLERRVVEVRESPELQALVQCIAAAGGEFEDRKSGRATGKLATALGKSQAATWQLLRRAKESGLVETEVSGKRTYSIRVVGRAVAAASAAPAAEETPVTQSAPLLEPVQPERSKEAMKHEGRSTTSSFVPCLDYGELAASLLRQATVAVNEHDALTMRVAELEAQVRQLEESNAYLEADKLAAEDKLAVSETQVEELRAQLHLQPLVLDKDTREGVNRAVLSLVS